MALGYLLQAVCVSVHTVSRHGLSIIHRCRESMSLSACRLTAASSFQHQESCICHCLPPEAGNASGVLLAIYPGLLRLSYATLQRPALPRLTPPGPSTMELGYVALHATRLPYHPWPGRNGPSRLLWVDGCSLSGVVWPLLVVGGTHPTPGHLIWGPTMGTECRKTCTPP